MADAKPPMEIAVVPVTAFQQNCSILRCTASGKAAIVDPGGEVDRILGAIDEMGAEVERILVTHGHIDHAGAVADLAERLALPIEGPHEEDRFLIESMADLPGHGPLSTVGRERGTNPFLREL